MTNRRAAPPQTPPERTTEGEETPELEGTEEPAEEAQPTREDEEENHLSRAWRLRLEQKEEEIEKGKGLGGCKTRRREIFGRPENAKDEGFQTKGRN